MNWNATTWPSCPGGIDDLPDEKIVDVVDEARGAHEGAGPFVIGEQELGALRQWRSVAAGQLA